MTFAIGFALGIACGSLAIPWLKMLLGGAKPSLRARALAQLQGGDWLSQSEVYDQLPVGTSRDDLTMALRDLADRGLLDSRVGKYANQGTASDRREYRIRRAPKPAALTQEGQETP
jgi:hypothetical protein